MQSTPDVAGSHKWYLLPYLVEPSGLGFFFLFPSVPLIGLFQPHFETI